MTIRFGVSFAFSSNASLILSFFPATSYSFQFFFHTTFSSNTPFVRRSVPLTVSRLYIVCQRLLIEFSMKCTLMLLQCIQVLFNLSLRVADRFIRTTWNVEYIALATVFFSVELPTTTDNVNNNNNCPLRVPCYTLYRAQQLKCYHLKSSKLILFKFF